jgi:hypothetical protein
MGSGDLLQTLMRSDLIDEYLLFPAEFWPRLRRIVCRWVGAHRRGGSAGSLGS